MKLNKIIIRNFRSYYGENQFELSDGLTLVIGDNGDGKTTFFEALEWLFDTSKINKSESNISEMRKMELGIGDVDEVSVTMIFEHGGEKEICKKFIFSLLSFFLLGLVITYKPLGIISTSKSLSPMIGSPS